MNGSMLVRINEKQYGPLSQTELRRLARKGEFSLNDQVWLEEEGEWVQAEQIDELKSLFKLDVIEELEKKNYCYW